MSATPSAPLPKKDTDAASSYTLRSFHEESDSEELTASIVHPLLPPNSNSGLNSNTLPSYGTLPTSNTPSNPPPYYSLQRRRPLLTAGIKFVAIFILSSIFLGGTLWLALPRLAEEDKPALHIPKSFADLQALNTLLKKYRDIYPYRIVVCFVVVYLFLQAFTLPGSMYMSIIAGALWGMPRAIPLVCTCVATGASLCYLLSAVFGPALLTLPKWQERLDRWSEKVESQRSNLLSFIIILRIAPLPPHWVVNVLCPHLRIGIIFFWISTFLGIMGVTIIHTAIGGQLDQMTSADDFHLISWKNFAIMASIVFAVLIPVGLRYVLTRNTPGGVDSLIPPSPVLSASGHERRDPDRLSLASDEFAGGDPEEQELQKGTRLSLLGRTLDNKLPTWRASNVFTVEADETDIELEPESSSGNEEDRLLATGPPARSK